MLSIMHYVVTLIGSLISVAIRESGSNAPSESVLGRQLGPLHTFPACTIDCMLFDILVKPVFVSNEFLFECIYCVFDVANVLKTRPLEVHKRTAAILTTVRRVIVTPATTAEVVQA